MDLARRSRGARPVSISETRLSILEYHVHEPGHEVSDAVVEIVVDVSKALARNQHLDAAYEDDVLAQERPILAAPAQVGTDEAIDVSLEQELLQNVGLIEPEQVVVGDQLELGSQLEVHAEGGKDQSGVHEVGLSLNLARAEVGHEAQSLDE